MDKVWKLAQKAWKTALHALDVANSTQDAVKVLAASTVHGQTTLVAGVSPVIPVVGLQSTSSITFAHRDPNASTALGFLEAPTPDRAFGAGGHFVIRAFSAANAPVPGDVSVIDWTVQI
jgi:hypothetical protein